MKKRIKGIKKYKLAGQIPGQLGGKLMGDSSGGVSGMIGGVGELAGMIGGKSTATTSGEAALQSVTDIFKGAGTGAKIGSAFGPVGTVVGGVAGAAIGAIGKEGGIDGGGYLEDPSLRLSTGFKGFGNKSLKREFEGRKNAIAQNRFNELIEGQLTESAYKGYDTDINLAQGGMIPESLAYVDDGEVIKTPDSNMLYVPEEGKPTDSNLVSLPAGSKILSDSLKVPGTKETFAQMGKRMMSKKKSSSGDKFALNSEKLNKMNDDMIHELLYTLQEMSKAKRGVSNKFKDGGKTNIDPKKYNSAIMPTANDPIANFAIQQELNFLNLKVSTKGIDSKTANTMYSSSKAINNKALADSKAKDQADKMLGRNANIQKYGSMLGGIGSELTKLAPAFSNLNAKAESFDTNLNPNRGVIGKLMAGRKYNINPAIEGVKQNRAISNYNAQQMNPNTGANMAYRLQSGINLDKAIMDLYSQKSNMDNQYAGQYADTLNNLGQQYVGAKNLSTDLNARSRAAASNIRGQGLKQLSDYTLNKELMGNLRERDMAMLDAYAPFLESIYKKGDYANLMKQYKR